MLNNNSLFEDDFDVPGAQPSSSIHVSDAPDLSQSAWYDLEDEEETVLPEDEDELDADAAIHQQQASMRTSRQTIAGRTTLASPPSSTSGGWRNVFSSRNIILCIVIIALISGGVFAKGFFLPSTTNAQNASQPAIQQIPKAPKPVPAPTHSIAIPTPATSTPAVVPTTGMQNVPTAWTASGRGMAEMLEALSVAETFTQRYETIDFRSPATLSSSRFILTNAANQRFLAQDKHNTDAFANQIQQQQSVQAALVTGTQLVQAQNQNGTFFAWITVSYQLTTLQGQGTPVTNNAVMTVLLVAAPFNTPADAPPMGGIGWLVSNYGDGNALPTIPATP